jgi:DNA-directed RNA polymerase specialized sigma24 family protein
MNESLGSLSHLYAQFVSGNVVAANELWRRFFPRLLGLANSVLGKHQLPQGAEDAVQEAFFQFLQSAQAGRYHNQLRRDDMWRLLAKFTVQRAQKILRSEQALKRGQGKVVRESELVDSQSGLFLLDAIVSHTATAECDMIFAELLGQLEYELQEIALMKLAGFTNEQVRDLLGCSLRSVERRIQLIRSIWGEYVQIDSE